MSCEIHHECGTTCKGVERLEKRIDLLEKQLDIATGFIKAIDHSELPAVTKLLAKDCLDKLTRLESENK